MSLSSRRLLTGAAMCAVVLSLVALPASAGAAERATFSLSSGVQAHSASSGAASRYLAGYRATDPDHVSEVVIKAVDVPTVSCSKQDFQGVALGAGSEPVLGDTEYFAGIYVTCVSGQPQYLMEAVVGDQEQATGIEPGDEAQIVITLNCDAYPTCKIFAGAASLGTDTDVSVSTTLNVTTDSAVFGAFPLFAEGSTRPAPVPNFGSARVRGCLFDNDLLRSGDAERLTRARHGRVQIRATKIHGASFILTSLS